MNPVHNMSRDFIDAHRVTWNVSTATKIARKGAVQLPIASTDSGKEAKS